MALHALRCKYCGQSGEGFLREVRGRGAFCDNANECLARQEAAGKEPWKELPSLFGSATAAGWLCINPSVPLVERIWENQATGERLPYVEYRDREAQRRILEWLLSPENRWHVCFIATGNGRQHYSRVTGPQAAAHILAEFKLVQDYMRAMGKAPNFDAHT